METRRVGHQAGNRRLVDVVNGVLPVEIERRRSQDGPIIRAVKRLNILQQAVAQRQPARYLDRARRGPAVHDRVTRGHQTAC